MRVLDSSLAPLFLVGLHALLGIVASRSPALATLHSLGTLGAGLFIAAFGRRVESICYVTAYISGAEVFWRMAEAQTFHEVGKYAIAAMFLMALLRLFSQWRSMALPFLYVALLLPSAFLTIQALGVSDNARQQLSFNLAGPIALGIAVLFFSQIRANRDELRKIAWALVLPIVSITAIAMLGTYGSEAVVFGSNSNYATSGGFGPNQVSATLGLGVIMAVVAAITERRTLTRALAVGLAIGFLIQAFLTFSRGGVYNAAIALGVGLIFYGRQPGSRVGVLASAALAGVVLFYLVLPQLNTFTGGFLTERFTSADTTNRVKIIQADLEVWRDNPFFGVGPGMARTVRGTDRVLSGQSHTEFSRALAEHGLLGLLALGVLVLIALRAFLLARSPAQRAWVACLAAWSLAEMTHSATRIAAISFVFGLACLNWQTSDEEVDAVTG